MDDRHRPTRLSADHDGRGRLPRGWHDAAHGLARRDLIFGLGAGTLAAAAGCATGGAQAPAPAAAPSAPAPSGVIRLGYAAITWKDEPQQAIDDVSALGYTGIQLRANILEKYASPAAVKDALAKARLEFVCYSGGGPDPAKGEAEIEKFMRGAKFAAAAGAKMIQATSPGRPKGGAPVERERLKAFSALLTELGKRTRDLGAPLVFHNHMSQIGQNPDEVDAILADADTGLVRFLLDTGHMDAAGGDSASYVRKYAARLAMLHLKDVVVKPGAKHEFVEMGQGKVDFKGVLAALREVGYQGWAVVELDSVPAGRSPKDAAAANKTFLEGLGLRV